MKIGNVYTPNIKKGLISQGLVVSVILLLIFAFPLGSLVLFSSLYNSIILSIAFFLALILLVASPLLIMYASFKAQSYEIKEDGIFVKRGIISKTQALILYSQIQDVQEYQGLIEKILNIGNLRIITMSSQITLVSMDRTDADEIKDFVLSVTNKTAISNKRISVKESAKIPVIKPEESLYEIHPVKKNIVSMIITIMVLFIILSLALILGLVRIPNIVFTILSISFGGVLIFAFFIVLIGSIIKQISFRINITDKTILVGSEFLGRNFVNLPYNKFQDVGLSRSLFDRLLHMASVTIETGEAFAPTENAKSAIPLNLISDLYEKDALELRRIALTRSGIKNLETEGLRDNFPLQGIKPLKKSISETFWLFVAIGILVIILYPLLSQFDNILLYSLLLPVIFFPIKLVYEIYYFRSYAYADNEEILELRKGVLKIKEVIVPYEEIQNVFIDQDMFDRIFGLYDVHLSTVGTISQMQLHIDGVSKDTADGLKALFLDRIS
jgi:membrane protein YdbS with pleckstrin-like domain